MASCSCRIISPYISVPVPWYHQERLYSKYCWWLIWEQVEKTSLLWHRNYGLALTLYFFSCHVKNWLIALPRYFKFVDTSYLFSYISCSYPLYFNLGCLTNNLSDNPLTTTNRELAWEETKHTCFFVECSTGTVYKNMACQRSTEIECLNMDQDLHS